MLCVHRKETEKKLLNPSLKNLFKEHLWFCRIWAWNLYVLLGPPQFVSTQPTVVKNKIYETWIFNIKAHTKVINRCFLTTTESEEKPVTEVDCFLSGDPPYFVLTVVLSNKDRPERGSWTLTLRNDVGSVTTTSSEYNRVTFCRKCC